MNTYAKLLLSGFLVVTPAVLAAQDTSISRSDCGFVPALKVYTTERDGTMSGKVSPQIVVMLEDGQNCLNDNLIELKANVKFLQSSVINNGNQTTDAFLLQDKLKQTELDLQTAQIKIASLEASFSLLNRRLLMAEDEIEWITLKVPAAKRKDEISKPTPNSNTSATTPHPTVKKPSPSKPKSSVSKPTPSDPKS